MEENKQKAFFEKQSKFIQNFPEACIYSCSKNNEKRNFSLYKDSYRLYIRRFHIDGLQSVRVKCENCGWSTSIPSNFAKKVFKNGLNSNLLIYYAKSKIITSRILNIWGSLWRVWLFTFGILAASTIIKFNIYPVQIKDYKEIGFADTSKRENLNKFVKINGTADLTYALSKEIFVEDSSNQVLKKEVYFPLFDTPPGPDYIVIKGNEGYLNNVLSYTGITNYDLLKAKEFTVEGYLEEYKDIENVKINNFFKSELPEKKNFEIPKYIINSSDIVKLPEFVKSFLPYYITVVLFFATSVFIQVYIDKKINLK